MRPNHQITVKPGQWVRVCFNAKLSDRVGAEPLVRARLSNPLRVFAVNSNAVRIGGDTMNQGSWHKSWIRCENPIKVTVLPAKHGERFPGSPSALMNCIARRMSVKIAT